MKPSFGLERLALLPRAWNLGIILLLLSPAVFAESPATCRVEVRLESIASLSATDTPDADEPNAPRGEYHVRVDDLGEVGPCELKAGESSSFSPGLLLKAFDTGLIKKDDGEEMVITVLFHVSVREDDSAPTGEDDTDDHSEPLEIRERVSCPGTTTIRRNIRIPPNPDFEDAGGRADAVSLSLRIVAK